MEYWEIVVWCLLFGAGLFLEKRAGKSLPKSESARLKAATRLPLVLRHANAGGIPFCILMFPQYAFVLIIVIAAAGLDYAHRRLRPLALPVAVVRMRRASSICVLLGAGLVGSWIQERHLAKQVDAGSMSNATYPTMRPDRTQAARGAPKLHEPGLPFEAFPGYVPSTAT